MDSKFNEIDCKRRDIHRDQLDILFKILESHINLCSKCKFNMVNAFNCQSGKKIFHQYEETHKLWYFQKVKLGEIPVWSVYL